MEGLVLAFLMVMVPQEVVGEVLFGLELEGQHQLLLPVKVMRVVTLQVERLIMLAAVVAAHSLLVVMEVPQPVVMVEMVRQLVLH